MSKELLNEVEELQSLMLEVQHHFNSLEALHREAVREEWGPKALEEEGPQREKEVVEALKGVQRHLESVLNNR